MKTALKWIFSDKINTSKDVTNKFENLNIKHDESVFVVNHSTKLKRKINPKDEKGKFTSASFITQKCIGQKHPFINHQIIVLLM